MKAHRSSLLLAFALPAIASLLLAGCGTPRGVVTAQRALIDSLNYEMAALQTAHTRLQEDYGRLQAANIAARDSLDSLWSIVESLQASQQQPGVPPEDLARFADSLRHAFVFQFNQGLELNRMLRGQTLELIYFAPASTDLTPAGRRRLDELVPALRKVPSEARILVEGHADDTSFLSNQRQQNNRVLSAERAAAVVRYLVDQHGFVEERFETAGYGSDMPLVPNDKAAGREINRRVRIAVDPAS